MEGTCSEGFFTASSDETECYLYPKRIKTECNQKNIEKEEQQKLEQSSVNGYQTSPLEPRHLSERQNNCALEKQSCDTSRKSCTREFSHFQTCSNERLPWRLSENKLSSKNQSPENEDQNTREDAISLNARKQPLETESLSVWSAAKTCEYLEVLSPPQRNNNVEQNNIRNGDNELKQNSSVTPLNGELFQMDSLSHKSVSDKKWKQYQLLQIPFLCDTSSVLSHTEHRKNIFLKKVCSTAEKDNSNSDNETPAEGDNKEKNNSSYLIPSLKPFKGVQPLKIPNFRLPGISSKISSKMPSTNPKEAVWKDFEGHPSLMQSSKQIYGEQKMSEIGEQKLQNCKSSVKAPTVGSELKENNYSPISKQEHNALAVGRKVSVACFRDNSTDIECNHVFAENNLKDKMPENSDAGDDQDSKIHIYISPKPVHNDDSSDPLKRMARKSSNEKAGAFHIQANIPAVTEPLEKKRLAMHCGVHNCNSDTHLCEEESKLSTKEILDFKRYVTKNIFESNSPRTIAQRFPDKKVSCNIFRGKEMFEFKFSFQNVLFGWVRTWTESQYKGEPLWQDDSVAGWFHFPEGLDEQWDVQELVKSKVNRNPNSQLCICLLAVISKHLKVELLKTIPSFFSSTSTLLPIEGKAVQAEKHPSCGRKQDQLNSCNDSALRQTTEFHKKNESYLSFDNSKFGESVVFAVHNECQRRHFSRSLGGEESTFVKRGMLLHNQKSGLCKGRRVRKQQLLSIGREGFSTYLRSVTHKGVMKKKNLVAKCLILLQGTFDCSLLSKMYGCNITKIQYLMGANLSFWGYFPACSQLKFEKENSKHTNQKISVTGVKQEKKKPSEMFTSSFHGEIFKAFPFVLYVNKKHEAVRCRNCIMAPNEVTNEVTYTTEKYSGISSCINADRKECVKSEQLQINSHDFHSKKSSIFDTYEKIPLTTDPEDFDQISMVNQDNSAKKTSEENVVSSSEEVHNLPGKSNDFLFLPEQTKTTMEKCNSLLLQGSRINKSEYCTKIGTNSPRLANKKVEDRNTYLNFESLFPGSSNVFQSFTVLSDSSSLVNKDRVVSEDGHCRSSSSAAEQNQGETIHAAMQCPSTGSPAVTRVYLQLEAEGAAELSLHGRMQANQTVSLEPETLEQRLEYVPEQEEINDEQMHATNESRCETVMSDLITSYSEDESETFIASEEKIKIPLSVINNGYSEDVKDKQLPLKNKITYEFELKRKFGLVLEELHMFHEISKGNENSLSALETNSRNYCELNSSEGIDENVTSVSQKKVCISSPICGTTEEQNITDSSGSSLNEKISNENEGQKIPKEYCISRLSSDELLHSPTAEGKHGIIDYYVNKQI